ncbi:MAG: hypothetical protein ACFUZC_17030 [Chthoniobacteraceae bacterium]
MKNEPNNEDYKILRYEHVVFVLRKNKAGTEFIALPGNTTDADCLRIGLVAPSGNWRNVKAIDFDSIQSTAVPGSEDKRY